jgi:hypothetical protein
VAGISDGGGDQGGEQVLDLVAGQRDAPQRWWVGAGQGCAIETALFERVSQPYVREGQRTGAMRFGDPRAMALAGALCVMVHAVAGFTNKSLRSLVAGLLGADYTSAQMTYDLRRLRAASSRPRPAAPRRPPWNRPERNSHPTAADTTVTMPS